MLAGSWMAEFGVVESGQFMYTLVHEDNAANGKRRFQE